VEPPEWVWIVLAIPTIASAAVGVALAVLAAYHEIRWRRHGRPRAVVIPHRRVDREWIHRNGKT
jgi:hypothetical protein